MSVTCSPPAKGCRAAQASSTASWREPPSAQPMMLRRLRVPSRLTFSGIAWIFGSRTNWARSAVTCGSASLMCQNSSAGRATNARLLRWREGRLRSVLAMQPLMEIVGPGGGLGLEQADLVHGLRDHQGPVGANRERDLAAGTDDPGHV